MLNCLSGQVLNKTALTIGNNAQTIALTHFLRIAPGK